MLYVTTQDQSDIVTDHRALRGSGGKKGLYVPYQLPVLSEEDLALLPKKSFGHRVADILNRFFRTELTGWDVELQIGRHPIRISAMSHRIAVVEAWHCPSGDYGDMEAKLYRKIVGADAEPSEWFCVALRTAMLMAAFGDLMKAGITDIHRSVDITVPVNDFAWPMAAWYARRMGLPIRRILCCCNENSGLWDLLYHGQLSTGARVVTTTTPQSDMAVPRGLQRLIYEVLGPVEARRFQAVQESQGLYTLDPEQQARLGEGLYCAVVRQGRVEAVIRNVESTNSYRMEAHTALTYAGLQDYRAAEGETGTALLIAEHRPPEG